MSIQKRTTKRHGTVYDVRLRDPQGRTYTRTFRTKREADRFEAGERTDRSRGGWLDPRLQAVAFDTMAERWLKANPAKRSGAWARDESVVRVHLDAFKGHAVGSITPRDVQALVNEWDEAMRPRTVRRTYGVLRAVLNYAVQTDHLLRSPCRGIKLPALDHRPHRVLDADELATLAEALGVDYAPMAYLGVVLGLRWGECAGLRVGRLDFLRSTLTVAEQVTRGAKGTTVEGPPKSEAGRRTLTAPKVLMDMLSAHLARRGVTGADLDARLFPAPDGGPLDYGNWRHRVWLPACISAGLGRMEKDDKRTRYIGLGFHDLRRANATAMVLDGVDPKTFQARQGHSDARLTLAVYAQVTTEGDRTASDRLGERFFTRARDERAMEPGTGDATSA